jgi:NADH-quinone oxidoreductase subunit J
MSLAPVFGSVLATDVNVAQNVGFYIIAAGMLYGAIRVVSTKNIVHSALWLVVVLGGVAAQYILAAAEFVAVSQIMVYIGAVMVLFLFGIMLTRAKLGADADTNNQGWAIGIPVALLMFGVLAWASIDAIDKNAFPKGVDGNVIREPGADVIALSTQDISDGYLGPYLVPLIAVSFVLLAAAVGAIVLARKD